MPLIALLLTWHNNAWGQSDDPMEEVLRNAQPASRPAAVVSPTDGPSATSRPDPLGTLHARPPTVARQGTLTLNDGTSLAGQIWTTLETPLRVWDESAKSYHDLSFDALEQIEVVVDEAKLVPDWRWLKEGSDVKIYSGKSYPNLILHYKLTLTNGDVVEGPVIAPIYFSDGQTIRNLALYNKYQGKLDETLEKLVYIKSIQLVKEGAMPAAEKKTTKLPLVNE